MAKEFLKFVIESYADKNVKELEQLTKINLYNRYLEYMLYDRQLKVKSHTYSSSNGQQNRSQVIKDEIINFIKRYDQKIDKDYVLFLFKIYDFSDGVKESCESLGFKQELLNYYI